MKRVDVLIAVPSEHKLDPSRCVAMIGNMAVSSALSTEIERNVRPPVLMIRPPAVASRARDELHAHRDQSFGLREGWRHRFVQQEHRERNASQ